MNGKNKYLIIIGIILLIILFSVICYLQYQNKFMETIKVEANIVLLGNDYIVVRDDDGVEYSLNTTDEYNLGDRLSFVMENADKRSKVKEGKVTMLKRISQKVTFVIDDTNSINDNVSNVTNSNSQNNDIDVNQSNNIDSNWNNVTVNDDEIVGYFENLNNRIDTYNNDKSIGESVKSGFVTVVDFLFYGGTIKGKTFKELGNKAKLSVLKLAFSIDSKIDKYFPGYKESISSTSKRVYTNVKSKALELYLDISTKICTNDPDTCYFAKEGLGDLKNNFSLTWDFIKEISGVGISKLKAWYEIWRES